LPRLSTLRRRDRRHKIVRRHVVVLSCAIDLAWDRVEEVG
jgi:hypothetical protein